MMMPELTAGTTQGRTDRAAAVRDFARSELFDRTFREGMELVEETAAYLDGDGRRESKMLSRAAALAYAAVVLWDIAKANVQVAGWVLLRRPETLRSTWLVVPLKLRIPEAITLLAGTITMTPGTVSCDLAADGSALLVHCLHTEDAAATVAEIKTRYEARLVRIFGEGET